METTIKPSDVCLAVLPARIRAVKVARVWISLAGTVRVEIAAGCGFRPGYTVDRRQCLSLEGLENLSAESDEKSAVNLLAGAGSR